MGTQPIVRTKQDRTRQTSLSQVTLVGKLSQPPLLQKILILGKLKIDALSEQLDPTVGGHGYQWLPMAINSYQWLPMATNGYHGYHVNVTQFIESSLKHTARSKGKRPDTIWCSREDHSNMSWIMHCSPALFICAGSAFPADGVVTKLRLNKGTQQVAGTWSQHTLALLGKAEASLPTHTCSSQ